MSGTAPTAPRNAAPSSPRRWRTWARRWAGGTSKRGGTPAGAAGSGGRGKGVDVLADGRARSDGRKEQPFPQLRGRQAAIRDQALRGRGQSPLRRDEQAAGESAVPRRRVFDRRHSVLSVDR